MVADSSVSMTLSKAIPADEMKRMILDNIPVSPKEAAERFKWDERLIQPENYLEKFNTFFDNHPELAGVDRDALYATIGDSFHLIDELTQIMIPTENGQSMNYHNEVHSKITAIQALKHTLGSIALASREGTLPDELRDPDNLNQFLRLTVISAVCHEENDWKAKPPVDPITRMASAEGIADKQSRMETAQGRINQFLEAHQVSRSDFNIFLDADNFSKTPEEVMAEIGLTREFLNRNQLSEDQLIDIVDRDDFDPSQYQLGGEMATLRKTYADKKRRMSRPFLRVEGDTVPSLMDKMMASSRVQFDRAMPLYTYSIGAADFGQVGNPEYVRTIKIKIGEEVYSVPAGPLALAYEMHKYTDNWAVSSGFGTISADGELVLNVENVTTGDFFWNNFALPRIQRGIASMKEFSPGKGGEGENAENLYGNIHHIVEENTAKLKASKGVK
ncbi:MAG: hypothetical protein WC851_00595 [Candidatus Shapirobacteria bacterium]|jgi:hypothetical protein